MDRANMTVATEVVMQSPEPMTGRSPLTMLDERAAQRLMDDLWNCGIRPTEGAGTAGSMAATAAHLADMRAIAFSLLKIEKPKR